MKCERARALAPLMADGELGPLRRVLLSRHVRHCAACAAQQEELLSMRAMLRTKLPFHRAPPALAARIGAALPREAPPAPTRRRFRLPTLGYAGTGLAGALAGVALTLVVLGPRPGQQDDVLRAVIGSHVRSLMADHLTDVLTSDQHTVKPFLSAHLDVSPPVRELKDQGFPLIGGRVDYVDGHRAAVVVYRHAKHVINLFAWADPGAGDSGFHETSRQGFNVVAWRRGGIAYRAVSDVEADQLLTFAHLVAGGGQGG